MKYRIFRILLIILSVILIGCAAEGDNQITVYNDTAVHVSNADDLIAAFADLRSDDVICLEADIDMAGKTLSVVNYRSFTLDGNGHTIRNYHAEGVSALFVDYCADRSYTIRNLTVENCSVISNDEHAALFVGGARDTDAVTITNCHAIDCSVSGDKYAAVFIAYTAGLDKGDGSMIPMQILDCSANNCNISGGGSTGIAIGHSGGNDLTQNRIERLRIADCTVEGPDQLHEGVVIGTAGAGLTELLDITVENTVLSYNFGDTIRSYYGRNLKGLYIDEVQVELTAQ